MLEENYESITIIQSEPISTSTCFQEDGSFEEPDWDSYECVFRKFITNK